MERLRISLLGPFRVALDGETTACFDLRTAEALLAYLSLHAETPCRRETLAGLLWPDQPERTALTNLRQTLSRLRTTIGDRVADPSLLSITRETIQLNPAGACRVDVSAFTELIAACAAHWHRRIETCTSCAERLERATALYRGDFLSGFSLPSALFEEWLVTERERFHRQALEALRDLAAYHEGRAEYDQAIGYARRQIEMEPWCEEAHRQLMRALALDGQRGAALAQYEVCRRTLSKELGVAPAEETTALQRDIQSGAAIHAVASLASHNLPASLTPFVGRETELHEIAARLRDPDCRLLTLVGPGGIGKTRLALQAAREQLAHFEHGVFFVSLAPVQSVGTMLAAVAQAGGIPFRGPGDPGQQLIDYLRRRQVLLVLDSFEHLVEGADASWGTSVGWVSEMLWAAPKVKVVVTSRTRLNARAEHLYHVGGMHYPERGLPLQSADLSRYSAVQLFVHGMRQVREGYEPTVDELAHVVRICRLAEGMPLAILLAAAWGEMLSPAEIATEVERGIEFLEADWRGAAERHRSLVAVFDSAWERLPGPERAVFVRLSVFRGGFAADAAMAVAGADLRTLRSLVYKSFLQRGPDARYGVHELLRQYAAAKLDEMPAERERTLDRHSAYYAEYVAQREEALSHRGSPEILIEIDNIRAAWRRAADCGHIAEVRKFVGGPWSGLSVLHEVQGWYEEGAALFGEAVAILRRYEPVGANGVALGVALYAQGRLSVALGLDDRVQLLEESKALLRGLGAWPEYVISNDMLAAIRFAHRQDPSHLLEESLAISREIGYGSGQIWALKIMSDIETRDHVYERAEQHLREALQIARGLGGHRAWPTSNLAHVVHATGGYVQAKQLYKEAIVLLQHVGYHSMVGHHLNALGGVALALGEHDEARTYCLEALEWAQDPERDDLAALVLANLGNVALEEGEAAEAAGYYRRALEIAIAGQGRQVQQHVLVALANWRAHRDDREGAVELLTQVLCPGAFGWIEYPARRHLEALQAELAPAVFAAAQARGRARDVGMTLQALLVELDETTGDGAASTPTES